MTKLRYIHMNPVRAGIVEKEEEYLNSFAVIIMEPQKGRLNCLNCNFGLEILPI